MKFRFNKLLVHWPRSFVLIERIIISHLFLFFVVTVACHPMYYTTTIIFNYTSTNNSSYCWWWWFFLKVMHEIRNPSQFVGTPLSSFPRFTKIIKGVCTPYMVYVCVCMYIQYSPISYL